MRVIQKTREPRIEQPPKSAVKVRKPQAAANEVEFESFVAPPASEKKRQPVKSAKSWEELIEKTRTLKDASEWGKFTPGNFVALYAILHEHVYKVQPDEVRQRFMEACGHAARVFREFGRDPYAMAEFMRWAWVREQKRFAVRDETNDFRIGFRYQFGKTLLSDYRVQMMRRKVAK